MWKDAKGKTSEDPKDFAEDIGKAALDAIGVTGACTVSKTINNISVVDFQARPQYFVNWHEPPSDDEE